MSAKAYLPTDYSSAVHYALDELRGVILRRQAQYITIAQNADAVGAKADFAGAMNAVSLLDVVLDDIAIAIQKEQAR